MGKGEIAHYEQFLLFPQCFQKACFPGASKGVIVWEWVNSLSHCNIDMSKPNALPNEFFRLVQNESIRRRQNICNFKNRNSFWDEHKTLQEMEKKHSHFFPQCFQKHSFSGLLNVGIVW